SATKFVVSGSTSQTAGATKDRKSVVQGKCGNTDTAHTGDKSLTFSGANASTNPATQPTVSDKTGAAVNFGTAETITFTSGQATVSSGNNGAMKLYKVETANIDATHGTITTNGAGV